MQISEEYRPITTLGYIGYHILFSIPIIGFICLLIFSFGGTRNINLRNYARSFLLVMFIAAILIFILFFMFSTSIINNTINNQWNRFGTLN